jgi:hypothetical protein
MAHFSPRRLQKKQRQVVGPLASCPGFQQQIAVPPRGRNRSGKGETPYIHNLAGHFWHNWFKLMSAAARMTVKEM